MKKILVLALIGLLSPALAFAQATPQAPNALGNASAWTDSTQLMTCQSVGGCDTSLSKPLVLGTALQGSVYMATKLSGMLDSAFGSTQGSILYRNASNWTVLTPGTSGQFLETLGAGANPLWANTPGGGGTPGGANTQAQFNSAGTFGGSSGLTLSTTKITGASMGLGSDAAGDLYYNVGGGTLGRLAIGLNTYVLTSNGASPTWAPPPSAGAGTVFTGTVTSSSSTVYAMTASGYAATAGNLVCTASFTPANGANPTLNVAVTGAKPIKLLTTTGLVSLVNSEIPNTGPVCFMYDGTNYVLQTGLVSPPPVVATHVVTTPEWTGCLALNITAAAQTITLPPSTGQSTSGCIVISTVGVTATLTPTGASGDAINFGQVGGGIANGAITIPADFIGQVSYGGTPGTSAYTIPLGPVQYCPLSWLPNMDLSVATQGIRGCRFATPRVVYSIRCTNDITSTTGHLTFFDQTDSGTIGAGTRMDTGTGFDMTTAAGTTVSITLTSTPLAIPAAYWLGMKDDASSTTGSGACQFTYR